VVCVGSEELLGGGGAATKDTDRAFELSIEETLVVRTRPVGVPTSEGLLVGGGGGITKEGVGAALVVVAEVVSVEGEVAIGGSTLGFIDGSSFMSVSCPNRR